MTCNCDYAYPDKGIAKASMKNSHGMKAIWWINMWWSYQAKSAIGMNAQLVLVKRLWKQMLKRVRYILVTHTLFETVECYIYKWPWSTNMFELNKILNMLWYTNKTHVMINWSLKLVTKSSTNLHQYCSEDLESPGPEWWLLNNLIAEKGHQNLCLPF